MTGTILTTDVSAGQYVASAGQLEPGEFPDSNNGVFYRNSRNGLRDITDGSSTTLMVGERSRNVADATWVGAVPTWQLCTNPKWVGPGMRPGEHAGGEPYGNGGDGQHLRAELEVVDGR